MEKRSKALNSLLLLAFIFCAGNSWAQVKLNFKPITSNEHNEVIQIDEFKFYISNVSFILKSGDTIKDKTPAHLLAIEENKIPLLSFDDIKRENVVSIEFTIGTDSLINVAGILDGDLDPIKGMYWAWNTGYINAKIEGSQMINNESTEFEYHLGGYLSPFTTSHQLKMDVSNIQSNINILINLVSFIKYANQNTSRSVLIPGKEAADLSTQFKNNFSIEK